MRALASHLAGKDIRMDRRLRGLVNQSVSEAQRGCCALQVGVIVAPRLWLNMIWSDYLYHQMCTFFLWKLTLKNSTVKRAYCGEILWWMTSWEIFHVTCKWAWNTLERSAVVCRVSLCSLKPFLVTVHDLGRGWGVTNNIRANPRPWMHQWTKKPWAIN